MGLRLYKLVGLLLTALIFASSVVPMLGRAEAQMRCAGASPQSAPCARTDVAAVGLTQGQVYKALMSCCRSTHGGCAMMRDCPMRHPSRHSMGAHRAAPLTAAFLSNRPCLVTIRVSASVLTSLAVPRARWLLTASPALAPTVDAPVVPDPQTVSIASWTYTPVLSPHAAPALHGLRAPPVA